MSFEKIKILLQDNIGLHTGSIGDSSIERAIKLRMEALEIRDGDCYLSRLISDQEEMDELVEEVVVPETWFFRNSVPFDSMVKCVQSMGGKVGSGDSRVRILSLPCSTGEEPYSIAIKLLKSGLPEDWFQIDAVDISKRALRKARRAIYGKHSFRETGGVPETGYFTSTRSGHQVLPHVKKHVNFLEGNILKDSIAPESEYYDIIFCRNLLIYFDRPTQKKALEKLDSMLKKNGILFVGHAETTDANKDLFTRLNLPNSFAYKKNAMTEPGAFEKVYEEEPLSNLEKIYKQLVKVTLKNNELSNKYKKYPRGKGEENNVKRETPVIENIFGIERLIEQGHLSDASSLCLKWLDEEPEKAHGYYLLGLISNLEGNAITADSLLKKAIYLDPNHHKALALSALLAEERGDNAVAESLRIRESRARKRMK